MKSPWEMVWKPEEWGGGGEIMSVLIFPLKKREPHKSFPFLGHLAIEWEAGVETPSLLGRMTDWFPWEQRLCSSLCPRA